MSLTGCKSMSRLNVLLSVLLSLTCAAVLCAQSVDLPPGPARTKMPTACLGCHDAAIIVQQRLEKAAWTREVETMMKWGTVVDPGDRDVFIEYLSANFPADKAPYVAPRTARTKKK